MNSENYSSLKTLVLEEIRGDKPTSEMSQYLNFKFDKYKRWMKGDKILKWDEFTELCEKMGLDIGPALKAIHFPNSKYPLTKDLFSYLKEYNNFETNLEVSVYLKCHLSVAKRYSKGYTIPDVETIFKLINVKPNRLSVFLTSLFQNGISNESLKKLIEQNTNMAQFLTDFPLALVVEAALSLENYKLRETTTEQWLLRLLNSTIEEIRTTLNAMVAEELLSCHNDNYKINNEINLDGIITPEVMRTLQSLDFKLSPNANNIIDSTHSSENNNSSTVFKIFSASRESLDKINLILIKAQNDILKSLREDSHPKEVVRGILLQHFNLME